MKMHDDDRRSALDEQVLATLRALTRAGTRPVMDPKRISRHIGLATGDGSGWRPSPQAVTASLRRLGAQGLVQRAGRSATCWTIARRSGA
ncbi:MAG: hypothetical protein ABSB73_09175 [Solirubrobacteraceae bacterium]|jgi:hypothetical protein